MALQGQIVVTPAELKSQSTAVKTQLGQMENAFSTLKNSIGNTTSFWKGEAGEVHRKRYTDRISLIEEMFRRYREHVTDLEQMAGVYEEGEHRATEIAESLPASNL